MDLDEDDIKEEEYEGLEERPRSSSIRNALNSKTARWAVGLIAVIFVGPYMNSVWIEQTQFNKDRAQLYHDSIAEYGKIKTATWRLTEYCDIHIGDARKKNVVEKFIREMTLAEETFVEKNPGVSIQYYFSDETNHNIHNFILWLDDNKKNICTEEGSSYDIYDEIRLSWPIKIYDSMRNKMYNVL